MRFVAALVGVLAILALPTAASAGATVRYVAKGGKDNATCSQSEPCLTVAHAITVANAGDTISIGPGTFEEGGLEVKKSLSLIGAGSGTASSYDPAHNTLIESTNSRPTIEATAGGSFSNLRLNGHAGMIGPFSEAFSALDLQASESTVLTFTVANVVATQSKLTGFPSFARGAVNLEAVSKGSLGATITNLTAIGDGSAVGVAQIEGMVHLNLANSTLTSLAEAIGGEPALQLNEGSAQVTNTTAGGAAIGFEINGAGSLSARNSSFTGTTDGVMARLNSSGKGTAQVSLRDSLAAAVAGPIFGSNAGVLLLSEAGAGSLVKFEAINSTLAAYGKEAHAGLKLESQKGGATTATIKNTIAYAADPTSPGTPRDILASGPGPATVTAESSGYSTVNPTFGATITPLGSAGNVSGNPAFVSPSTGNFTLAAVSPLLEHGNLALMEAGELDLAGNPHVESECGRSLNPDIGAYELQRAFACPLPGLVSGSTIKASRTSKVPRIGSASISAPLRAHRRKRAKAGKLVFTLNEAATVDVALKRLANGHLRKRACVARVKACKRLVTITATRLAGKAGKNTVAFPSIKLVGHLQAAHYELVLVAVSAQGTRSASRTVKFTLR
jgi:hypothetical protein